jgi:hypothetical protein
VEVNGWRRGEGVTTMEGEHEVEEKCQWMD